MSRARVFAVVHWAVDVVGEDEAQECFRWEGLHRWLLRSTRGQVDVMESGGDSKSGRHECPGC